MSGQKHEPVDWALLASSLIETGAMAEKLMRRSPAELDELLREYSPTALAATIAVLGDALDALNVTAGMFREVEARVVAHVAKGGDA